MIVDPMVIQKSRVDVLSTKLTKPSWFYVNCGGYAFGINAWYTPSKNVDTWAEYHRSGKNHWRNLERSYAKNILCDFPELKCISHKDVKDIVYDPEEYEMIAFRIRRHAFFGDFHFMRMEPDGNWTEKKGSAKEIYQHRYETIFDAETWGEYDGKLFFFVRLRKDHQ